jgi:hypothetical protein
MPQEDEFKGRDKLGLQDPDQKDKKPKDESAERKHYFGVFGKLLFLQAPAIAIGLYSVATLLLGMSDSISSKCSFIYENGLGYMFLAWYLVFVTRTYASINANGARAPSRLDRPDQHIYKIMAKDGELVSNELYLPKRCLRF